MATAEAAPAPEEDWGGALGPGGEEVPAWWKDEAWTPEVNSCLVRTTP